MRRGGPAIGLLKSIDGGTNWSVVGAQYLAGLRITSIVTSLNSADKDLSWLAPSMTPTRPEAACIEARMAERIGRPSPIPAPACWPAP